MIDYASRGAARSRQFRLPVLKIPSPDYCKQVDKPGSCSAVWISNNSTTVLKAPLAFHLDGCDDAVTAEYRNFEKESVELLEREKEIYMHLGEHKGILPCLQMTDSGLVFPYLKNGNLRHFLCNSGELITFSTRQDWIQTALRSIEFIHSKDVLQADISARNFLVANDLSLSLCDFAGSMVGTRKSSVRPEARYEKVGGTEPVDISVESEVFAIGSLIYEISTGKRPYDEIEDDEVEHLFRQRVFPTTSGLYFGGIIDKCWLGHYKSVAEILHASPFTEARHI